MSTALRRHEISPSEEDEWSDIACRICAEPERERAFSEVVSLVRGMRWVKHLEEVQDAITILSTSRVIRNGVKVDGDRVEKVIARLCAFTDPDARD